MEPTNIRKLSYEYLVSYTNNFSESNYIGRFQFGKLYRGMVRSYKTLYWMVKIWEVPKIYKYKRGDNELRVMREMILLRHEMIITHPGMVKLYGYHWEGDCLAVVYKFKPLDSLFNLIPKDDFIWLQRIKAALGLASVLRFLHAKKPLRYKPFVVDNLDAAHIVLDEDYNPKLCDFGFLSGGIFGERKRYPGDNVIGCYGYTDIDSSNTVHCSNKQDVFAVGVILLGLISKRVHREEDRLADAPFVYEWARRESQAFRVGNGMKDTEFSLVHENLTAEPDFCRSDGHKITKLALECINGDESQRPTMKQVHRCLLKLEVVKKHACFLGVDNQSGRSSDSSGEATCNQSGPSSDSSWDSTCKQSRPSSDSSGEATCKQSNPSSDSSGEAWCKQ